MEKGEKKCMSHLLHPVTFHRKSDSDSDQVRESSETSDKTLASC